MSRGAVPATDLRDYADSRGLAHRGQSSQVGWMAALGMSEELQFNVLRGVLPGGEHGIVFHDVRIMENPNAIGIDHATQIAGPKRRLGGLRVSLRDFVPGGGLLETTFLFKLPATTAAIRLPEANGLVLGLMAGRAPERGVETEGQWTPVAGGPRGWMISARTRADPATVDAIVRGPLTELLGQHQPLGFEVRFRFGTLTVSQAHFAEDPAQLDEVCEKASWLARQIRAICASNAEHLPFTADLPEAEYAGPARQLPNDTFYGGDYQNLGAVVHVADELGLAVEDQWTFMRGFAWLPFPGEAFGVMRGTLPGTNVRGRVVVALERRAMENKLLDESLEKKPGGPFGCDTVLLPVDPATPATPGTEGEQWVDRGRVAIRDGVLCAWRARERMSPQRHEVELLVADALNAVRERGVVC